MTVEVLLAVLAAGPPVWLEVDECVGEGGALEQQVSLELGAPVRLVPRVGQRVAPEADVTSVRLSCVPLQPLAPSTPLRSGSAAPDPHLVLVEVLDPTTGKAASRRIDPGPATGSARRRLLALATAELISASWLELTLRAAPSNAVDVIASPPARAAAAEVALEHPRAGTPTWLGSAQLSGFTLVGQQHALGLGARVGVERLVGWRVALRGELAVDHAAEREPLGTLDSLSASALLGAQLRGQVLRLPVSLGFGARLGVVRLLGLPDDSSATAGFSRVGPWLGGAMSVRARVASPDRAGLCLGLEVGLVVRPFVGVRSDGTTWGLAGGWVAFQLGWELPW